jgi:hypothetical protein
LLFSAGFFKGIDSSISKKDINSLALDPLLWPFILQDIKFSRVLVGWVVWLLQELQLDQLRLVLFRPIINLVHLFHLRNKRNGRVLLLMYRRKKRSGRFRKHIHGHC